MVAGPEFVSEAGKNLLEDYKLRDYKIEPPDLYIGATFAEMKLESGIYCWNMSPEHYAKAAVKILKRNSPGVGRYCRRNASRHS